MNWIAGMQHAIDYTEEHITEQLDYEAIAGQAYTSSFYFQRMFGMLCGCTLGEYIRARRLTLAGLELAEFECKVIDAALKYGYDSPESFTRAFTKFHGISPSQARKPGASLRSFSRLSLKLVLEGGNKMDYRIEKKGAFKVLEKAANFSTANEVNFMEIPKFWTGSKTDGTIETLCRFGRGTELSDRLLGICYGDGHGETVPYSIASGYNGEAPVPEGFRVGEIPAATWIIFKCRGAMPDSIQKQWRTIFTEFFPTSDYAPINKFDIEAYPEGDQNADDYECEIWIAVEKK